MIGIPAVMRLDVLILSLAQMQPCQPVMFDVIDHFQVQDCDPSRDQKQRDPRKTADQEGQNKEPKLERRIAPERVRRRKRPFPLARQQRSLRPPSGVEAISQNAWIEAVKSLVIACGHRITRCADITMMDKQVFTAKMPIHHHAHQQIAHPALQPCALMHQFMGIDDADAATHDTERHEQPHLLACAQRGRALRDIPKQPIDHDELHREPNHRDHAEPV